MNSFEQIVATAFTRAAYDEYSTPAVAACKEFAEEGRFAEMAKFLNFWLSTHSPARTFLTRRVPSIVLNRYVNKRPESSLVNTEAWLVANPAWADRIALHCLDASLLPAVISKMCASIDASAVALTPCDS